MLRAAVAVVTVSTVVLLGRTAVAVEVLPSPEGGFLTAWLVAGPVPEGRAKDLIAAGEPKGKPWRLVAGPTLRVDAGKAGRPKARGLETWFAMVLVADKAMDVELKVGADGAVEPWLDGKRLSRHEQSHLVLWDDHVVRTHLARGRHTLLLRTQRKKTQNGSGWRIACRIHDALGRVPPGLRFELPEPATGPEVSARAVRTRITPEPTADGFRVVVAARLTGSAASGVKLPWRLELEGTPLAEGTLTAKEPKLSRTVVVRPAKDGPLLLTARAGVSGANSAGVTTEPFKLKFRKAWHVALARAVEDRTAADPARFTQATLDSVQWNLEELRRLVVEGTPDETWLGRELTRVGGWARALKDGQDPFVHERGAFYRAYRSPYDARLQHYSVHLPPRYDGGQRWPLVIGLHGIGSGTHYTLRRVLGKDVPEGEHATKTAIRGDMPVLADYGVLTATAWGYHNSAFWFYGEDDVTRIVDEMKAAYRVDPDRVYLTGLSLGGLGTYHVGLHYPDMWAALGPLGGFSTIKLYQQILPHPKTPWEKALIEQRDATSYAENGKHLPMKVVHGKRDNPAQAKAMTNRFEKLGYTVELDVPDLGHDVWQYSYGEGKLVKWLKRWKRPANPDQVVLKTHSYRYTRAYWVRIGWIEDYPSRAALVRVRVDGKDRNRVVVDEATNVRGLTLNLGRPKLGSGPYTVEIAGERFKVPGPQLVHLRREGTGPWRVADSAEPPAGWKRQGVSGPLDDVMFEPHLFVVGTQDPSQTDVNRRLVREDRRYLRHHDHDVWFPMVDDVHVTDADLRDRHLVLYGNSASNKVLARLLEGGRIPLSFEPGKALTFAGKRYEGAEVGIKLVMPNPLSPSKMVVIVAGVSWRGTLASRFLPRFLPDYIVYDGRITTRYDERLLIDRPVRAAGFFTDDWRVP